MDNRYINPKFRVKFLKESSLENTPVTPGNMIITMDSENVYYDILSSDDEAKRINVTDFYTTEQINTFLSDYYTKSEIDELFTGGQGFSSIANTNLDNLTEQGENHFTNKDLSNLTPAGEKHFLNKTQLANCILEAPNGVATYSGTTITVKQGLKVLIPNGRNADGTLNNIEYTVPQDLTLNLAIEDKWNGYFILYEGFIDTFGIGGNIWINDDEPDVQNGYWYSPEQNRSYFYANGWLERKFVILGEYTFNANFTAIAEFKPYEPVSLAKWSDIEYTSRHIVTKYYRNGTSWYRLWSDGFIEQGGTVPSAQNGDVVTFLQPYSTVILAIQVTCAWVGANYNSGYNTPTLNSFKFYTALTPNIAAGVGFNWYSCGY